VDDVNRRAAAESLGII